MARRRNESLVETALSSQWPVSAVIALFFLLLGHVILPSSVGTNPYLLLMAQGFKPILSLIAGFFGVIAGAKWFFSWIKSHRQATRFDQIAKGRTVPVSRTRPVRLLDSAQPNAEPTPRRIEPVREASEVPARDPAWSLELLQSIEWKRFEDLCQRFYSVKGIRCACTPLGPDGGIDIRLFQRDDDQTTAIVQCKAWGDSYVGVKPVRELLGVMVHEKVAKAFFMTTGKYSDEAKTFAEPNRITLIDGSLFVAMIKRLPKTDRDALYTFATTGDFTTPTCPACGLKMRLVAGKEGRHDFWGCANYPRCRQKLGARKGAAGHVTAAYA